MDRRLRTSLAAGAAICAALAASPAAAAGAHEIDKAPLVLKAAATPNSMGENGAYTYDATLVPAGAWIAAVSTSARHSTTTALVVRGLLPGRTYGAHIHVNPCGAAPAAAGPHYQQVPDPVQPSVDPAYANPENEIWLDFKTDQTGSAVMTSVNRWRYRAAPGAVVIHAEATQTEAGHAGMAGARVACLTLAAKEQH